MTKKEIMKVLVCLVLLVVTSTMPASVFALSDDITSVSDTSARSANEMVSALQADQEVKFNGTAIEYFSSTGTCSWKVRVEKIVSGPSELQGHTVTVALWTGGSGEFPSGSMDPEIGPGDKVEVYGLYVGDDYVTLSGSEEYYITKTSASNQPSVTVRYPNGGESISIGTQVQVSADATDDTAVTGLTFYYSRDGGSNWALIGEGVKVSGTDKDGIWNRTWNSDGLSAGTNYTIKAVASDGTSTSEDQSDGTFSLTSSNVIYVPDDYLTIQAAVDAASPGNTIMVRDGTYIENVDVNKRLTIKSENSAENCIVQAANSNDDVFEVTMDYVTISGFTVKQVRSPSGYASGIVLGTVKDCEISGNNINFSSHGIALVDSKNNIIKNNIVRHTGTGISLRDSSNYNIVKNNTLEMNNYGISLYNLQYDIGSDENTITCNKITSNLYGIELRQSNSNLIYLNDLNANNAHSTESTNLWNSPSKITYTYNGNTYTNYLGNYWYDYRGSDANGDGIGDTPYSIDSQRDKYPLMEPFEIENNVVTALDAGPDQTVNEGDTVSFSGSFNGPNTERYAMDWDFGDENIETGTLTPIQVYADNGVYTVTLTVTDHDVCVETDTLTVTVNNVAPTVDAGPNQTVGAGGTVTFSGSFTDPGTNDTHSIKWSFGDGGSAYGTLTPTHTYIYFGTYAATLIVTDDDGARGIGTLTVIMENVG